MNHLWQSTIFAAIAALLTLALRKNRAQIRYRIWLAVSLKFLLPFSLLVTWGRRFEWRSAPPPLTSAVEQISQPFALPTISGVTTPAAPLAWSLWPMALTAVWLIGFALVCSVPCSTRAA